MYSKKSDQWGPLSGNASVLPRTSKRSGEGEDEGCKHHGCPHALALPVRETLQSEAGQTNDGSHDHHGVQADEAAADEAPHSQPAVGQTGIVGIAHDEAGEDEEEIHGQKTVVEMLFGSTC